MWKARATYEGPMVLDQGTSVRMPRFPSGLVTSLQTIQPAVRPLQRRTVLRGDGAGLWSTGGPWWTTPPMGRNPWGG